jgi:hypothetical protein
MVAPAITRQLRPSSFGTKDCEALVAAALDSHCGPKSCHRVDIDEVRDILPGALEMMSVQPSSSSVPVTVISEDTCKHVDHRQDEGDYEHTNLLYLKGDGVLHVGTQEIPIRPGLMVRFNDGMEHWTTGCTEDRVILGPMDDEGCLLAMSINPSHRGVGWHGLRSLLKRKGGRSYRRRANGRRTNRRRTNRRGVNRRRTTRRRTNRRRTDRRR